MPSRPTTATSILSARSNKVGVLDGEPSAPVEVDFTTFHASNFSFDMMEDEPMPAKKVAETRNEAKKYVGCSKFMDCLYRAWGIDERGLLQVSKRLYIETTVTKLAWYLVYTCLLITISILPLDQFFYYHYRSSIHIVKSILPEAPAEIVTKTDVWNYITKLTDELYPDCWYNNASANATAWNQLVHYDNEMLGFPQIRQVRVRPKTCSIPIVMQNATPYCSTEFYDSNEDKSSFMPQGVNLSYTENSWTWRDPSYTKSGVRSTSVANYPSSGYVQRLSRDKATSTDTLAELRANNWIDKQTRAVFIDLTFFNRNRNLFCVIEITFEFLASAKIVSTFEGRSARFLRYMTTKDFILLGVEIAFLLMSLYYLIEVLLLITKDKLRFFYSIWNWLDLLVLGSIISCTIFNIYRELVIRARLRSIISDPTSYESFEDINYFDKQFNRAIAFCLMAALLKASSMFPVLESFSEESIFKYIKFEKSMHLLIRTLAESRKDFAAFLAFFLVMFFAFSFSATMLFSRNLKNFSTFSETSYSLYQVMLGSINFGEMRQAHYILGPLFLVTYVVCAFFVMFQMFIAFISIAYHETKHAVHKERNDFELSQFVKKVRSNY
ncbi:TRP-like ion channel Pkd2 [Cichlidogyrus casuarinus]|uniref:TRP-like ion channel Pkd2 n=1 Tax=Cichlidogyrus casuarinus TaxID=1844966 RepID=A0ABD2QJN2_9PLAT